MKSLIGIVATALLALGCSSSGNNSTGSTGSTGSSAGSGSAGSGSTGSGSTGSGSTGSSAGDSIFPTTSELYVSDEDDAGNPRLDDVELIATSYSVSCADLEAPNFAFPTTPFTLGLIEVSSMDGSNVVPGTYPVNFLSANLDGGQFIDAGNFSELLQVNQPHAYPDGGGPIYIAGAGTISISSISGSAISGSFEGGLIDFYAFRNSQQIVDAGRISGTFSSLPWCQ